MNDTCPSSASANFQQEHANLCELTIKLLDSKNSEIERLNARIKELEEYEYMYKGLCK